MRICVYCSSSVTVDSAHVAAACEIGMLIGERGHTLVYGGAQVGLMGQVAQKAMDHGAQAIGVMPRMIAERGLALNALDELIITETMAERKAGMIERADAFLALPGGFGTLEELSEVLTLKQLGYLRHAVVLLNTAHIYDQLLAFFETLIQERFARAEQRQSFQVSETPIQAIEYIETYKPGQSVDKWL